MQLHHETIGTGPPVIILHGLFGSLDNWRSVAKDLAAAFQVISVDQRNHGRSEHHSKMSYPSMAEDIRELMDSLSMENASFIGHSMGGKTAMEFALRHPDRATRLLVVDIAPRAYSRRHDHILDALLSLDLDAFQTRQQIEEALASSISDRDVRRFLLKSVTRNSSGRFEWLIGLKEIEANYDAISEQIAPGREYDKPCLFIRGANADYVQPDDEPLIRELFPRATIRTISGAGHWVHAEAPMEFKRMAREFLVSDRSG
jgi:esterase